MEQREFDDDYESCGMYETPQSKLWRDMYVLAFDKDVESPARAADYAVHSYNMSEYLDDVDD